MYFWASLTVVVAATVEMQVGAAKKPAQQRVVLQFRSIDKCKMDVPLEIFNSTITRSKLGANVLSAALYNHKPLKSFSKLEATVDKCKDAVSYNTCEYEGTHKFAVGLCQLITSPTMPWGEMFKAVHPPIRCPLPAGPYILTNGIFDMNEMLKTVGTRYLEGTLGNIYVAEVRCFNEKNELHVCLRVTYSIDRVRG